MAGKVHGLLPHVAEDEIMSSDDDSSDSEESDVEVDVIREPVNPLEDGDVHVDQVDVHQLTDEQLRQQLTKACEAADQALA